MIAIVVVLLTLLVLVLIPVFLCIIVPCMCPDSSLALWVLLQKEKLNQKRLDNTPQLRRKDARNPKVPTITVAAPMDNLF